MIHCNTSRTGGRVHTIYKASRIPPAPAARAVARCDWQSGGCVDRDASRQITLSFGPMSAIPQVASSVAFDHEANGVSWRRCAAFRVLCNMERVHAKCGALT